MPEPAVAIALPESIGPYIALMATGFVLALMGHIGRSRWLVTIGVIMIFLATLVFPILLQLFAEQPTPPDPPDVFSYPE